MESMLRRFGLKKGEHRDSEARQRLQKELFAYNKVSLCAYYTKFCRSLFQFNKIDNILHNRTVQVSLNVVIL